MEAKRRLFTCEQLLLQVKGKVFLYHIMTGDEKWIHYDNPKRRRKQGRPVHASTSSAKPNMHGLKFPFCFCGTSWVQFIMSCSKPNETITGDPYQLQLIRLSRALTEKLPLYEQRHDEVILQSNNIRPHVAKPVKMYLEMLKWKILPHPLYSPDIAPSDYHLLRTMTC